MEDSRKRLYGVRGWLLFFVLTLTVLGPSWKAWRTYSRLQEAASRYPEYAAGEEWADIVSITWMSFGAAVFIGVLVGIMLLKWREANSVRIAVVGLWIMGPLISVVAHLFALERANLGWSANDWGNLVLPTASAALWTAYLLKSRRVRNTYNFAGLFRMSARDAKAELQS